MNQTKFQSGLEVILNTLTGMILAFVVSQLGHILAPSIRRYIWGGFVWDISAKSNVIMTIILTLVSMSRSYAWRRYFNNKLKGKT